MEFVSTPISDLWVIKPKIWEDARGYFFESFNARSFEQAGQSYHWVQDNEAKSGRGVTRGLHYQCGPHAQAKLVRVITGKVLDVAVDLRPRSATFGHSFTLELSGENKRQLLIPRGFAHGYQVLEPDTVFAYKCDNFYHPPSEGGIIPDDPELDIPWILPRDEWVLSAKDAALPLFDNHRPVDL